MDVIATARQLGKAIQQDERYLRLMVAQQMNDSDEELQSLIGKFNLKRIDLNGEINKSEKDQEKITAINGEVKELYAQIMANKNMSLQRRQKRGRRAGRFRHADPAREPRRRGPRPDRTEERRMLGQLLLLLRLPLNH